MGKRGSVRYRVRDPHFAPLRFKQWRGPWPWLIVLGLAVLYVVGTSSALKESRLLDRINLHIMLNAMVLVFAALFIGATYAMRPGRARVTFEGSLHFRANRWFSGPLAIVGCLFLLLVVLDVVHVAMEGWAVFTRRDIEAHLSFAMLVLFGVALLVMTVPRLSTDSGLAVMPQEVTWLGMFRRHRVVWEDIKALRWEKGVLSLGLVNRTMVQVQLVLTDADPVIVAETVRYFVENPRERGLLEHPTEAFAAVVEEYEEYPAP
ncbi:MAG: hypothetical protein Q4D79_11115 [Propionibacteriaceae bacterium]|nr:hypothetical protein [Propionibacteriaceae bacterium]